VIDRAQADADTQLIREAADLLDRLTAVTAEAEILEGVVDELFDRQAEPEADDGDLDLAFEEAARVIAGITAPNATDRPVSERREPGDRKYSVAARKQVLGAIESAGVWMSRVSEAVYRTPSGSRVAMPFSAEGKPGTWWLGAYEGAFDEVLLLCESGHDLVCLHLSREFVRDHVPQLSRDSKGNIKFHVARNDNGDYLLRAGSYGNYVSLPEFDSTTQAHLLGRSR